MRAVLWAASLAAVLFLSLWPFRFVPNLATEAAWLEFATSWGWRTPVENAVANVALFVPVGVLGMLAFRRLPKWRRAAIVVAVAFAVAVAGQAGQVVVPVRTATLIDAVWNMVGLLPGLALGLLPWNASAATAGLRERLQVLPWLILSIWIGYRLVPFVPLFDWHPIEENLERLLLDPIPELPDVVINAAAWLAAGYLMQAGDRRRRCDLLLPLLMAAVMGMELLIVRGGGLTAENLAGGLLGLGLWLGLVRHLSRPEMVMLPVLAMAIVVSGLWPFIFAPQPMTDFLWLPFAGLLGGSLWFNLLAVTYKGYLYAAVCFATFEVSRSWRLAGLSIGALVLAIEILQRYQPWHVPEITDPLLVLLACLAGAAFMPARAQAGAAEAPRAAES